MKMKIHFILISFINLSFADRQNPIIDKTVRRNPWFGGNIANGGPGGWGGNGGNALGNGNGGNGGDGGPGGNGGNVWIGFPNGVYPVDSVVTVAAVVKSSKLTKRPKPWNEIPLTTEDEELVPTTEFECDSEPITSKTTKKKPLRSSKKPNSTKKPFSKKTTTKAMTTTENGETGPLDDYELSEDRIAKSSTQRPSIVPILPILRPWLKPAQRPQSPLPEINTQTTNKEIE